MIFSGIYARPYKMDDFLLKMHSTMSGVKISQTTHDRMQILHSKQYHRLYAVGRKFLIILWTSVVTSFTKDG